MGLTEVIERIVNDALRIGSSNIVKLVTGSDVVSVKNDSDTLIPVEAGAPTAGGHLVTKTYGDANYSVSGAGAVQEIKVEFDWEDLSASGSVNIDSTAELPVGAVVQSADLKVLTTFDGGVSIELGTTSDADAFMATSHNTPGTADTYSNNQRAAGLGSASVVRATVAASGTPTQGEAVAFISYSIPQS
jgi:hypothetical protein